MINALLKSAIAIYIALIIGVLAGYGWAYYHYFIGA